MSSSNMCGMRDALGQPKASSTLGLRNTAGKLQIHQCFSLWSKWSSDCMGASFTSQSSAHHPRHLQSTGAPLTDTFAQTFSSNQITSHQVKVIVHGNASTLWPSPHKIRTKLGNPLYKPVSRVKPRLALARIVAAASRLRRTR
jgi:hypothetical protein